MADTQTMTRQEPETRCPTCGAGADRGQLICLECGSRIALAYRRPPSWRVPVAIVSVVILAAAAGLFFGLRALEDDADKEVAAQPVPRVEEPGASGTDEAGAGEDERGGAGGQAGEQGKDERGEEERGGGERGGNEQGGDGRGRDERVGEQAGSGAGAGAPKPGPGGVRTWPDGRDAFTVVILSSEDRRSATAFARSAVKSRVPAGVLRADDYPALSASTGFFIVFVGSYPNQAKAGQAAGRLGRRFQGAFPQFVDGSKRRGR